MRVILLVVFVVVYQDGTRHTVSERMRGFAHRLHRLETNGGHFRRLDAMHSLVAD